MSRPLLRNVSGVRISGSSNDLGNSYYQMKDKTEKEDSERICSADHITLSARFPFRLLFFDKSQTKSGINDNKSGINDNGYVSDSLIAGTPRCRHKLTKILMFGLVLIVIIALLGSLWWAIFISSSSSVQIFNGYMKVRDQVVSDLVDIGDLAFGPPKLKEVEFCSSDFENYVPCFNASERRSSGYSDRHCENIPRQTCIILPPQKYKIPLRWPTGKDVIWIENVKITAKEVLSSGSFTKRMMMLDEEQISFSSASPIFDGVEDYSHQIAEMIGLRNQSKLNQAGIRTILDVGCGYGSFGAHLFSELILTMCIANYETSGSQVQLTLERGFPAMIGSFTSKQLPYPSLSFDMIHCARCGIDWDHQDGHYLIEIDRLLRPGGYFVWTSPLCNSQLSLNDKENQKRWVFILEFADNLCWKMLSQQENTVVWKKTTTKSCYSSRRRGSGPAICGKGQFIESPYYQPLQFCISGLETRRWIPLEERPTWPSRANLNENELAIYGLSSEEFMENSINWKMTVNNYWSLLSPLIFSDHPKRPGDEDPLPPYNIFRNVLDMNARFGGFNYALLEAGKSVWVMNVVPSIGANYLPLILDRGFVGVLHDWCEAFPTYPRTYDMVHADGLLTLLHRQKGRCTLLDIFTEIDRFLRPEGWVIVRDASSLVESTRTLTTQLRWDARVIEIESNDNEKLLICQKPFFKRTTKSL